MSGSNDVEAILSSLLDENHHLHMSENREERCIDPTAIPTRSSNPHNILSLNPHGVSYDSFSGPIPNNTSTINTNNINTTTMSDIGHHDGTVLKNTVGGFPPPSIRHNSSYQPQFQSQLQPQLQHQYQHLHSHQQHSDNLINETHNPHKVLWEEMPSSNIAKSKPPFWGPSSRFATGSRSLGYDENVHRPSGISKPEITTMSYTNDSDEENLDDLMKNNDASLINFFSEPMSMPSTPPSPGQIAERIESYPRMPSYPSSMGGIGQTASRSEFISPHYVHAVHSPEETSPHSIRSTVDENHHQDSRGYERAGFKVPLFRPHSAPDAFGGPEYVTHHLSNTGEIEASMIRNQPPMRSQGIGNWSHPHVPHRASTHVIGDNTTETNQLTNTHPLARIHLNPNDDMSEFMQTSSLTPDVTYEHEKVPVPNVNRSQPPLLKQRTAPVFSHSHSHLPKTYSTSNIDMSLPQQQQQQQIHQWYGQQPQSHIPNQNFEARHYNNPHDSWRHQPMGMRPPQRIIAQPQLQSRVIPTQVLSSSHASPHSNNLNVRSPNANIRKIERICQIVKTNSGITIQVLSQLYQQQFGEPLPVGTQLLKALVQLPRLLLMSRKDTNEMVVFFCNQHASDVVVDILRGAQERQRHRMAEQQEEEENNNREDKEIEVETNKTTSQALSGKGEKKKTEEKNLTKTGTSDEEKNKDDLDISEIIATQKIMDDRDGAISVLEFTKELEKYLHADLRHVNVMDFLKRWRVVELIEEDENDPAQNLVRLVPMGGCTVLLGNLSQDTTEAQIRKLLRLINPAWAKLRIRVHKDSRHAHAHIDFLSLHEAETAMTQIKRNKFYTPDIRVEIESTSAQKPTRSTNSVAPRINRVSSSPLVPSTMRKNSSSENDLRGGYGRHKNTLQARKVKKMEQFDTNEILEVEEGLNALDIGSISSTNTQEVENKNKNKNKGKNKNKNKSDENGAPNKTENTQGVNKNHNNGHELEFDRMTQNIYQVIRSNGGRLLMSQIASKYEEMFGKPLDFDGNPKYFVKMEKLLLLNCENGSDDVMLYYTPEPAYKLVVSILKQNASNAGTGLPVDEFREQLEQRMGMSLSGCDFSDFLMRWRFLSIRESPDGSKTVLFTPHSGSTVFFGNLNVSCTEEDIFEDLEKVDPTWRHASVRLKLGKGFSYAFVDFPTRSDAMRAVEYFDDKAAFKSKNVSADIEAIEQRKRYHGSNGGLDIENIAAMNTNDHLNTNNIDNTKDSHTNNKNNEIDTNTIDMKGIDNINNHNGNGMIPNKKSSSRRKVTVYLGNLRDSVTKQQILNGLAEIRPEWRTLTTRLNLRSGWSHAFIDFDNSSSAKELISCWNNKPHKLSATRLRCEISKRQM